MKIILFSITFIFSVFCFLLYGCNNVDVISYKTFTLNEGTVHFSLEYRTYYRVDDVKPGANTGIVSKDIMGLTLISPQIKRTKDYTRIKVIVDKPDELIPNAKANVERAENNAASWGDYKLLNKYETTIDGVLAYRLDYQNRNIIPAIAGVSNEHFIEVYREVYFDAKGFVWMVQMSSDSSTADTDLADFEHILQTFKVLN